MPTGTLTPPDTWSRLIWDSHMFYLLKPILFPTYRHFCPDYALRTPLVTGTFALDLYMFYLLRPIFFPKLSLFFRTMLFENPFGTGTFALDLHMFYLLRPIFFPKLSLFFRTMLFEHPSVLLLWTCICSTCYKLLPNRVSLTMRLAYALLVETSRISPPDTCTRPIWILHALLVATNFSGHSTRPIRYFYMFLLLYGVLSHILITYTICRGVPLIRMLYSHDSNLTVQYHKNVVHKFK